MKFTDLAVSFRQLCEPRYLRLPDAAKALHIAMKAWAADQQTDGLVPEVALQLIPGGHNGASVAEIVASGLWSSDDGVFATDWTGQILAADAYEIAEKNRKRWNGLKRHQRGRHGAWCPKSCTKSSMDAAEDSFAEARGESSATVPNLTGPDRTDPPGIGKGGSGIRRSEARPDGTAALAPPWKGGVEDVNLAPTDAAGLIQALRAAHVDDRSPIRTHQQAQLRELLPKGSVDMADIIDVLRFALTFDGAELRDIDSGVGAAVINAGEVLGAAGFPARWVDAAKKVRAIRSAER